MPSPKGNYLFVQPVAPETSDFIQQLNTAYYQIKRLALVKKTSLRYLEQLENGKPPEDLKLAEVGQLRRPKTMADVRKVVPEEFIGYLKKATEQSTDEQFLSFLNTHSNPADYGVLGSEVALQLVLGNVYLDTDVKPGMMYLYQVIRVDKSNKKTFWAQGITVAGAENETLGQLNTQLSGVAGDDSLVTVKWHIPINPLNSTPKFPILYQVDPQDQASRRNVSFYPTEPRTIRASVWLFNDNSWKKESTLIPTMNDAGDTLTFYWSKPCVPEEVVRVFLLPQDLVENPGTPSDTATAVAIGNNKIKLIYGAKAQDTTDAIRVSWAQLPAKPYYTGIEIARDNGADSTFSVIAQLTPSDSSFYDYYIRPGVSYTYRVRPLFIPLQGLVQSIAAEAIGTGTKFSRPLPVSDLQVQHEGRNIRLNWTGTDSPSVFSYYVYRGTSKDNLSRVSGTLRKTTTFLDSSDVLSGRSEYFYSILTMNLTQDTSELAPPVAIRPLRSIETTYPKTVEAALINKEVWLSWNDVRTEDNILTGFIIQRKSEPNGMFRPLSQTVLDQPSFTDTTLREGQTVWYRVAAVTAFGDTTAFSNDAELSLPRPDPDPVFTFYVRNISQGIEVSWPRINDGKREKYGIYRREATSDTFTKIGEASSQETQFLDPQVESGTKYVYSVTSIEAANRESKRVKSLAIVRE
ncbi:fibronectin type III domain-containing protein [Larkinella bovis]|uniref:Fibronectin type III domain-containing protein n=2 Tax=Larkinella bovis TaxID=683041 RepID=A0ABW0I4Z4_9BACT